MTTSKEKIVADMRQRFVANSSPQVWDSLWKDQITPWDLGGPTPPLISELNKHWNSSSSSSLSRNAVLHTLVPGCGSGYDLVELAKHHQGLVANGALKEARVIGLDVSETSLAHAAKVVEDSCSSSSERTMIQLVKGDFFDHSSSWQVYYGKSDDPVPHTYNFIYDYTFFCALPPSLRASWGKRICELLNQQAGGRLLTLMFPVHDADPMVGPPFPVHVEDYVKVLEPHGVKLESEPYKNEDSVRGRADIELVGWWSYPSVSCDVIEKRTNDATQG